MQVPDIILAEIGGNEQLLWSGRPRQGFILRGEDIFAVPFSVVWLESIVRGATSLPESDAQIYFVLFFVPFILLGIYAVIGRFFVDARWSANTFYAVTSQRIIIVSGFIRRRVKSIDLKTLSSSFLSIRSHGDGVITFGSQNKFAALFWGFRWPDADEGIGLRFDLVPQGREVYQMIQKAQEAA